MIKKMIVIILAVAAVAAGIFWTVKAREPTASETQADFCIHLRDFDRAVLNLRSIDQNSTLSELKDAQRAVQESWEVLQVSSSSLKVTNLGALQASYSELENLIQSISTSTGLGEAQTEIYLAALNTLADTLPADQESCKLTKESMPVNVELLP